MVNADVSNVSFSWHNVRRRCSTQMSPMFNADDTILEGSLSSFVLGPDFAAPRFHRYIVPSLHFFSLVGFLFVICQSLFVRSHLSVRHVCSFIFVRRLSFVVRQSSFVRRSLFALHHS